MSGDRNVKAIKAGTFRGSFNDPTGYGNYVSIEHDDGIRIIYAHLESVNKDLYKGQRINEGTVLGREGTTGNSTGIHLHLEGRKSPYTTSDHIDIAKYIGIKNELGNIKLIDKEALKKEAMKKVQMKAGLEDKTIKFLDSYEFNEDLFIKLANAMGINLL